MGTNLVLIAVAAGVVGWVVRDLRIVARASREQNARDERTVGALRDAVAADAALFGGSAGFSRPERLRDLARARLQSP